MWFKRIFRPRNSEHDEHSPDRPLFDEHFLRRLERISLQTMRTLQGNPVSGEHPGRHLLPSSIFSDHRPYVSGDDFRYVDWNVYARLDHLVLKLGEREQHVDVHMLLDVSRSMAWGKPQKLRMVQQLAGALGYLALTHGDRVQVVPFGAAPLPSFGPARGKGRLMEMFRYLETLSIEQQTHMQNVLEQHARRYRRGGMLILCSDLLAPEGLDMGLRAFAPPRWQVLVFHIIDPRELRPELRGPLDLTDAESGQRLSLVVNDDLLAAYRHSMNQWQELLAQTCSRRGAAYVRILTTWPLEQKVIPFLRARRLLV